MRLVGREAHDLRAAVRSRMLGDHTGKILRLNVRVCAQQRTSQRARSIGSDRVRKSNPLGLASGHPAKEDCPADLDASGAVGLSDLVQMLAAWGLCPDHCPEDLDDSGDVGLPDLLALLATWGPCD